jgi:hypothetical protein
LLPIEEPLPDLELHSESDSETELEPHSETNLESELETEPESDSEPKLDTMEIKPKPMITEKTIIPPYILDPFSVIVKLAILSKKESGSKICIHKHVAYIQEQGIFQPIVRYFFNASKDDLSYLYNPIEIACSYFLKKYSDIKIRTIFLNAQSGLHKLIEHYKQSKVIVHTLFMYYNIISNYISNTFNTELFIEDEVTSLYTPELMQYLHSNWTREKITLVVNMFTFVDQDSQSQNSVKCLDEFMSQMDKTVALYFENLNK